MVDPLAKPLLSKKPKPLPSGSGWYHSCFAKLALDCGNALGDVHIMRGKLFLCLLLILILSPVAMTQNDSLDQETRLIRIEVTTEQTAQRLGIIEGDIGRIDGRLDALIMWFVGLLAASFISIFVLILQVKTQLSEMNVRFETQLSEMNLKFSEMNLKFETQLIEMNAKFGLLQKDVSNLNEKVDGFERRIDKVEERVDGFERRIGVQLNQIQKALAKQLDMELDDEPLT